MEVDMTNSSRSGAKEEEDDEGEEDVPLPGFRFHPTDQELVGFYLRRKVEKRPVGIDLIKQIDIYKYDPWDLPKASNAGDGEWYFFSKRGRKYRNSIRPNRVTGSGFWKATGIDRPIYPAGGMGGDCIGLKKSLVYYRGAAGKGTKTEWMMHEFRLPPEAKCDNRSDEKSIAQEAEVWTLCRILKRSASYKKGLLDYRQELKKRNHATADSSSRTAGSETLHRLQGYISFQAPAFQPTDKKPVANYQHQHMTSQPSSICQPPLTPSSSGLSSLDANEFMTLGDWDDLRSIMEYADSTRDF